MRVPEIGIDAQVDWFNNRRIHGSIGMITPAEFERNYYARISLGN